MSGGDPGKEITVEIDKVLPRMSGVIPIDNKRYKSWLVLPA